MTFTRLTWGVKASFRAYVEAAGGTISVNDGATRDAAGAFVFTALPGGDLAIPRNGPPTGADAHEDPGATISDCLTDSCLVRLHAWRAPTHVHSDRDGPVPGARPCLPTWQCTTRVKGWRASADSVVFHSGFGVSPTARGAATCDAHAAAKVTTKDTTRLLVGTGRQVKQLGSHGRCAAAGRGEVAAFDLCLDPGVLLAGHRNCLSNRASGSVGSIAPIRLTLEPGFAARSGRHAFKKS
jgi:hypothetical protein